MGKIFSILLKLCNLRMVILLLALAYAIPLSLPELARQSGSIIDRYLFRLGLDFSDLPAPTTPITVVHVPSIEFDSWLYDLPSANNLQRILDRVATSPAQAGVVGIVLDRPISLLQSEAETLLAEIHQGRTTSEHLHRETSELLQRRELLVKELKSTKVVLGLSGGLPGNALAMSVDDSRIAHYPQWLRHWLWSDVNWQLRDQQQVAPVLEHFPILADGGLRQFLFIRRGEQLWASFGLEFLRSAERQSSPEDPPAPMAFQPGLGVSLGDKLYPTGPNGAYIPVYGAVSGIRASLRQLTLSAALSTDALGGWVVVGRDGSSLLDRAAQSLAALGDRAVLTQPLWWSATEKALYFIIACFACLALPRLRWHRALLAAGISVLVLSLWSVFAQALYGLALPVGNLLCFFGVAWLLGVIWSAHNRREQALTSRADQLSLDWAQQRIESGDYRVALEMLKPVATGPQLLSFIYGYACALRRHGHTGLALLYFDELCRRRLFFRDVRQQRRSLRQLQQPASGAVQSTENACAESEPSQSAPVDDGEFAAPMAAPANEDSFEPQAGAEQTELPRGEQTPGQNSAASSIGALEPQPAPSEPVSFERTQALPDLADKWQTLGRYELQRELGRGANGTVYLGFDPRISRQVAVKTLNYGQFSSHDLDDVKARFFREAEAAGRLSHPNIVPVFDVGEQDKLAYIAMDFARGLPLSDFVTDGYLLPPVDVYRIAVDVADALAYAHSQGIVHRDIKPGNIMFSAEPYQVRVTDFGIARMIDHSHTSTGEILGSPLYMAPEQLRGHKVGAAADIFSLGVTFYQLLCGQLPFSGDNLASLSYEIVHGKHPSVRRHRKDLPASATRITNLALQKKPADRFASAKDMADALRKALKRDFAAEMKELG